MALHQKNKQKHLLDNRPPLVLHCPPVARVNKATLASCVLNFLHNSVAFVVFMAPLSISLLLTPQSCSCSALKSKGKTQSAFSLSLVSFYVHPTHRVFIIQHKRPTPTQRNMPTRILAPRATATESVKKWQI